MLLLTSSVFPLMAEAKRLVKTSWWEGLAMGKTGSCSGGQGLAQHSFNPIICWRVKLHSLPGGCLVWGDPALESTGSMVGLVVTSKRVYAKGDLPVPLSCGESLPTHSSTGGPPTLAGSFGSVSCGATASLGVLADTEFCSCSPKLESLYPPVLWKSYNQISLAPFVGSPGWEAWCWVQNLDVSVRTSLVLLFSCLWVTHLAGIGFDFTVIVSLLPFCCGFFFVFGCGYFLLVGSSILLSMVFNS